MKRIIANVVYFIGMAVAWVVGVMMAIVMVCLLYTMATHFGWGDYRPFFTTAGIIVGFSALMTWAEFNKDK